MANDVYQTVSIWKHACTTANEWDKKDIYNRSLHRHASNPSQRSPSAHCRKRSTKTYLLWCWRLGTQTWNKAISTSKSTAMHTANVLLGHCIVSCSIPNSLLTDNGPHHVSKFFATACEMPGLELLEKAPKIIRRMCRWKPATNR